VRYEVGVTIFRACHLPETSEMVQEIARLLNEKISTPQREVIDEVSDDQNDENDENDEEE